jgi:hypothetical protein
MVFAKWTILHSICTLNVRNGKDTAIFSMSKMKFALLLSPIVPLSLQIELYKDSPVLAIFSDFYPEKNIKSHFLTLTTVTKVDAGLLLQVSRQMKRKAAGIA